MSYRFVTTPSEKSASQPARPHPFCSNATHPASGLAVVVGVAQFGVVVAVIHAVLRAGADLIGASQAANARGALDLRATIMACADLTAIKPC